MIRSYYKNRQGKIARIIRSRINFIPLSYLQYHQCSFIKSVWGVLEREVIYYWCQLMQGTHNLNWLNRVRPVLLPGILIISSGWREIGLVMRKTVERELRLGKRKTSKQTFPVVSNNFHLYIQTLFGGGGSLSDASKNSQGITRTSMGYINRFNVVMLSLI